MISDEKARQHIASNIQELLKTHDPPWTQADLARATNERETTISLIVRGAHVPQAARLARIAEALDVSLDYLVLAPPKVALDNRIENLPMSS